MIKLKFGCDMDGTTFEQMGAFLPYYKKFNPNVNSIDDLIYYDPEKLGFPMKDFYEMLKSFEHTKDFLNMKPLPGAIESVNKFYDIGGKVYYITARNSYKGIYQDSLDSLEKNKAKFEKLFLAYPKLDLIQKKGIVAMAEDRPEEIYELSKNGICCICVNRPYNKEVKENDFIKRCEANQIFECFMDNYSKILLT
ncbi:hypothetical protein KAR52_00325 [Candidatus Pacearchaeota archaeon]|nr:hypothetical protein [Candidatus Pacearchaeota archaeon]